MPDNLARQLLEQSTARLVYKVPMQPVMGGRFQPTGFPDLGAATYVGPSGRQDLLVESAQSMANRLESVCWDEAAQDLVEPLRGMPYVRVERDGAFLTSSVLEAHRLNSPYVLDGTDFGDALSDRAGLGEGTVDRARYAAALLHFDPNSLVHGSFMSKMPPGTARLERLLSGFIEAYGVERADSGGVKFDRVKSASRDDSSKGKTAKEGYGHVPFHRTDYTAGEIAGWFGLDLAALRGLRLPDAGAELVVWLSLYKVRAFVDAPQRLRTACDLEAVGDDASWVHRPTGAPTLPDSDLLEQAVVDSVRACTQQGLFAEPPVTVVQAG